jgi:hypothetical protein
MTWSWQKKIKVSDESFFSKNVNEIIFSFTARTSTPAGISSSAPLRGG